MKAKKAWELSKIRFPFGGDGQYFAEVYWKNPETGKRTKGLLITISGDVAIEISWDGTFVKSYPAIADYYYPVKTPNYLVKRGNIKRIINTLQAMI